MIRFLFALILALSPVAARAQDQRVIRIWGPPAMRGIAERWAEEYRRVHPEARFELTMRGSDTAIPGLYGGVADIALMGRANDVVDDNGFSRTIGYPATRIEIANGSLSVPGKSDAIAILVDAANPIASISLAQLASAVDCGGAVPAARTWGDLGLKGAWAAKPIRIHSYDFGSRTGAWFQHVVTRDGRRMCWDRVAEYGDLRRHDGTIQAAADRIGDAARGDRYALTIANPAQARDGLKLVALADGKAAPVLPTAASVIDRRYPLARRAYAFVDRKPGRPLDPRIAAFLRWTLSPAGQALLAVDHGYLPLDRQTDAEQLALLERMQ
ncbi:MAG: phosphate transport system substrate-binding protein [Sphingomonadales bacterium]|jgi:phosphate transport system substrate-binding protein|nr:phosphate transport system substrate-binding protein [Sphingomonadales bacterium]